MYTTKLKRGFTGVKPKRATQGSAGYDLAAFESIEIPPGALVLIPTGTTVYMPNNEFFAIYPRSSLAIKKRLMLANNVGIIDSDYNKPIMIPLYNFGTHPQCIEKGERIAQGIFQLFLKTNDDKASGVRSGGFGSTGRS